MSSLEDRLVRNNEQYIKLKCARKKISDTSKAYISLVISLLIIKQAYRVGIVYSGFYSIIYAILTVFIGYLICSVAVWTMNITLPKHIIICKEGIEVSYKFKAILKKYDNVDIVKLDMGSSRIWDTDKIVAIALRVRGNTNIIYINDSGDNVINDLTKFLDSIHQAS